MKEERILEKLWDSQQIQVAQNATIVSDLTNIKQTLDNHDKKTFPEIRQEMKDMKKLVEQNDINKLETKIDARLLPLEADFKARAENVTGIKSRLINMLWKGLEFSIGILVSGLIAGFLLLKTKYLG